METWISNSTRVLEDAERLLEEGKLPAKIFNDPGIYELEKERIFNRAWVFLGHESEIPKPGDYVLRYIADNRLILVRDEDEGIQALLNACRHRRLDLPELRYKE